MDRASLRREIGERIRVLRTERQIGSQEALADRADLHRTYIGRLERGETGVTVETMAIVSTALGISLAEFFRPWDAMMPRRDH
jgi:transcriptional regulator with XRE-family HTH domain